MRNTSENRRQFFQSFARSACIAAVGAIGVAVTQKSDGECAKAQLPLCKDCAMLAECRLPSAESERAIDARFQSEGGVKGRRG